jgi:very-short-patch-repair endonuclease
MRSGRPSVLMRERMDFLILFPGNVRVVLEVDGRQHYAEGNRVSPRLYAEMMTEDRRIRLCGYEIYRFGGYEFTDNDAAATMLRSFFDDLLARYRS